MAVIITVITSGCTGINASKSISPLDFFLPGLVQNKTVHPQSPASVHIETAADTSVVD